MKFRVYMKAKLRSWLAFLGIAKAGRGIWAGDGGRGHVLDICGRVVLSLGSEGPDLGVLFMIHGLRMALSMALE